MELTGTVIALLPEVTGQGKNGTWRKQEFILEIPSQYPKKVCIALWGDKIDEVGLKQNDEITASIDVESREYNNRWYTEVKAWKIEKNSTTGTHTPKPTPRPDVQPAPVNNGNDDELPF